MSWSLPGQIGRSWLVARKLHQGDGEDQTWARTQQAKLTTLLDKPLEREFGVAAQLGQQLHRALTPTPHRAHSWLP